MIRVRMLRPGQERARIASAPNLFCRQAVVARIELMLDLVTQSIDSQDDVSACVKLLNGFITPMIHNLFNTNGRRGNTRWDQSCAHKGRDMTLGIRDSTEASL